MQGTPTVSLLDSRFGLESLSSPGVVLATRKFTDAERMDIDVQQIASDHQEAGDLGYSDVIPEEEYNRFTQKIRMCYRQCGFRFASQMGPPLSVLTGDGTNGADEGAFVHDWWVFANAGTALQKFTTQGGVTYAPGSGFDNIIQQMMSLVYCDFSLNTKRSADQENISCQVGGYAGRFEDTATPHTYSVAENSTMLLDMSAATAGSLVWVGRAGAGFCTIPYNAIASAIQTLLRGSGVYGAGNVTVVDGDDPGTFLITFISAQANKPIALPRLDLSGLTGTASVRYVAHADSHLIRGGVGQFGLVPVRPNEGQVFYGSDPTDPFNTAGLVIAEYATDVALQKFSEPVFRQNSAEASYGVSRPNGVDQGRVQQVMMNANYDREGIKFLDYWRNRTKRGFGMRYTSPIKAAGTTPFMLEISGKVSVKNYKQGQPNQGVASVQALHHFLKDPDAANAMFRIRLFSDVPSYTNA